MPFDISPRIRDVLAMTLANQPLGVLEDVSVHRVDYFHRQTIGATGARVTFFNVPESPFVCNFPGNSAGLPRDHVLIIDQLRCNVSPEYDADGNAESAGAPYSASAAAMAVYQDIRAVVEHGLVKVVVGDKTVGEFYGLYKAPQGGGLVTDLVMNNTTATTVSAAFNAVNGMPHDSNGYQMTPPLVVGPNTRVRITNEWQFNRDITANSDLTIKWELCGRLIKPANY